MSKNHKHGTTAVHQPVHAKFARARKTNDKMIKGLKIFSAEREGKKGDKCVDNKHIPTYRKKQ